MGRHPIPANLSIADPAEFATSTIFEAQFATLNIVAGALLPVAGKQPSQEIVLHFPF